MNMRFFKYRFSKLLAKKSFVGVLMLYLFSSVMAQRTITGLVVDSKAEILSGVNIKKQGLTVGTVTNVNGQYSISGITNDDVLIFRFIGFEDQHVAVGNDSIVNVVMSNSDVLMEELVVVGYGTERRKDLTGAVASVDMNSVIKSATANYDQALAGRVAGVQVSSSEGTPGAPLNIVIRGGNSITGDNSPLYVIDGIPLEDFDPATINSRDIKSFDILKDASATAIYGSRGANGVIVITTKQGNVDGSTSVEVGASWGVQYIPTRIEVLSPYEYVKYKELQALTLNSWNTGSSGVNDFYELWLNPELYKGRTGNDWQNLIFRAGLTQDYNLSISGGAEATNFYYSGQFLDQEGTLINSGFQKINNHLKLNHKINLKTSIIASLQFSNNKRSGGRLRESSSAGSIKNAIRFRPVEPITDENPDIAGFEPMTEAYMFPPDLDLMNTEQEELNNLFRGYAALEHKITQNLTLRLSGNYQVSDNQSKAFYGEDTQQGSNSDNHINGYIDEQKRTTVSTSNTLSYYKRLQGGSKITMLAGIEGSQNKFTSLWLRNTNLPTDELGIDNLGIATLSYMPTTDASESNLWSYFGRINYSHRMKYLLTVNFRADGSSKFANENHWGYFPSFSGAWHIGEEPFLKNNRALSSLKLRAGWGLTGNNRIKDFLAYNTIAVQSSSGYVWGENENYQPGAIQNNLAVSDLRWETTSQTNIGLDFSIMNFRVQGTLDYYNKQTKDLLLFAEMALSTGFSNVMQNVGQVSNQGVELSLTSANIKRHLLEWETNFNISMNRNKTIGLNSGQLDLKTNADFSFLQPDEYHYITSVGQPVGMMYGMVFDGIYQLDDFYWDNEAEDQTSQLVLKDGIPTYSGRLVAPGLAKYVDQNGDGIIDESDKVVIGNPHPKHFGGITNNLIYKNFDISILFQWAYGFDVFNANRSDFAYPRASSLHNRTSDAADAWSIYHSETDVNTPSYNGLPGEPGYGFRFDNRYVEDGSYLKLKTISVGYSIPKKMLKTLKLKECRIYASGHNLYTWTQYSGYDPEVSVKSSTLTPNLDYSAYPQSTTIMGGIEVKF